MPRDGATIFSDLIGKLDVLRVSCDKCGRDGCYGLHRLIEKRGREAKLVDWLDAITADCAKKRAGNMNDRCGATVPAIAEGAIIAANVETLVLLAFLGRGKRNLAVVGLALLLSCCTNERGRMS